MKTRIFNADDQNAFAELSGDFNPMHVDPIAARRFMYGEVVVHGIHALMHGISNLLEQQGDVAFLRSVSAEFRAPVKLGTAIDFSIHFVTDRDAEITASAGDLVVLKAKVSWSKNAPEVSIDVPGSADDALHEPRQLSAHDLEDQSGTVTLFADTKRTQRLLPVLASRLPLSQIATLLACTRVIGMHCPGYHSVFSDLNVTFEPGAVTDDKAEYRVVGFDDRFRLATIELSGAGHRARMKAFLRPAPAQQPSMDDVGKAVKVGEFSDRRALVIGGSRGLGELVAKILAAGGADVVLTYRSGEEDASRVSGEINSAGFVAQAVHYAAHETDTDVRKLLENWRPTDLCFFATPVIHKTDTRHFNAEYFDTFATVYVKGFTEIFDLAMAAGSLRSVLYPSSVAVGEYPKGMGEYAAAKAAGEALCEFLAKRHPRIRFSVPRLPRVATDQTASVLLQADKPSVEYFADLLRPDNSS